MPTLFAFSGVVLDEALYDSLLFCSSVQLVTLAAFSRVVDCTVESSNGPGIADIDCTTFRKAEPLECRSLWDAISPILIHERRYRRLERD